uniref:BCL2/adenovirus E1B 19 kDa protein-interacting protein 2-like n=2 Tax=Acanthochromis polyacanthus TaxID=80966 RepID=A0A3Q1FEQ1_9TELE
MESEQKSLTPTRDRPAPPSSLALSGPRAMKKKVLVAPALSLSLGGSESTTSDDFPTGFLSPSPDDEDDTALDFDLDAIETPSDSESLHFPLYDLDLEDDLRRLGVASRRKPLGSIPKFRSDSQAGSVSGIDESSLGALEREDMVDSQGIRWRCFSTGEPPQECRVNMSVLEPFLRVLSHGGYYGDGMNDIIVFSSCYLPENSLENYQYVMDNLFRFVVGTLELMVAENYVIVYLCAGGQKDKLPGISWLKEWYTTIDRRLRKNLKGFYVVHPTWYIKALITIIKPFISSKFSRKLQFVNSLQELSDFIPTEHVQIPDCVREYDQNLSS